MTEEVQTGGVMNFRYDSSNTGKLSEERKREIEEAYKEADERKKRKKNKASLKSGPFFGNI